MSSSRTQVVVVGGGIIGLCTAWYLQKAGAEVTVLSADSSRPGASSGNAGMIVPSHLVPLSSPGALSEGFRHLLSRRSPFYIKPRLSLDLLRWLWRFVRSCSDSHVSYAAPFLRDQTLESVRLFSQLQAEIGEFGWKQTGLLMLYRSEKYRAENLETAELAQTLGLRVRAMDAQETRTLEPGLRTQVSGSVLYQDDGRVDPPLLMERLHDALMASGVEVREGAVVERVTTGAGGTPRLQLQSGEEVEAETVVLAAGAWTGRLARPLGVRLPIQPAKGYSLTLPAPLGGPSLPMILSEEKVTITPLPGRLRFAGTLSLTGFDSSVDSRRVESIRAQVAAYLPDASEEETDDARIWSGFRPASPDGLPMVGHLKVAPRVFVAAGHGMLGVTLGPVTGHMAADLVVGKAPIVDPAPVDPNRFL